MEITALLNSRRDAGIGISFFLSAFLHLAVFLLLLTWNNLFPVHMTPEATYYVDIVNLPVAAPQQGASSQSKTAPAPVPPPQTAPKSSMTLPQPAIKKPVTSKVSKPAETGKTAVEADDFEKRMNRLQNVAESRQQEENIERMRNKVTSATGKPGAETGVGNQAGSDYLSYITSRLSEVFNEPPNTAKQVFTEVKIRINGAGKLELLEITKSSGNQAFDNYAKRSVYEAEKNFTPPPKGKFEFTFRFRPQGITHK